VEDGDAPIKSHLRIDYHGCLLSSVGRGLHVFSLRGVGTAVKS